MEKLFIILAIALCIGGVIWYLIPYLKAKKVNIEQFFKVTNSLMALLIGVTKTIKEVYPQNKEISIMDKIVEYSRIAVANAEQLYKISEIKKEDRKSNAEQYVYNILSQLHIEITPEVKKIVSGAIESEVYNLK